MNREDFENWYQQGLSDFNNAKKMYEIQIYDAATFYCEQSIQKLLKALWIKIKRSYPPKTHNIVKLGKQLNAPPNIISNLQKIAPYYYISRYPDAANGIPSEIINKSMAHDIINSAEVVINWIKNLI